MEIDHVKRGDREVQQLELQHHSTEVVGSILQVQHVLPGLSARALASSHSPKSKVVCVELRGNSKLLVSDDCLSLWVRLCDKLGIWSRKSVDRKWMDGQVEEWKIVCVALNEHIAVLEITAWKTFFLRCVQTWATRMTETKILQHLFQPNTFIISPKFQIWWDRHGKLSKDESNGVDPGRARLI